MPSTSTCHESSMTVGTCKLHKLITSLMCKNVSFINMLHSQTIRSTCNIPVCTWKIDWRFLTCDGNKSVQDSVDKSLKYVSF